MSKKFNKRNNRNRNHNNNNGQTISGNSINSGNTQCGRGEKITVQKYMQSADTNDISWYTKNKAMFDAASNISYNYPTGAQIPSGLDEYVSPRIMPGIMAVHLAPTFGPSSNFKSPLNLANSSNYSFIRHANSGSSNYEATDLGMVTFAAAGMIGFYSFLCRLYGVLNNYTPMNKYYPETLVRSMGVDFDDLISKQPELYWYIANYAKKIRNIAIPNDYALFTRQAWAYSSLYLDDNTINAQTYLFVPDGFWKYDEGEETGTSGKLIYEKWFGDAPKTMFQIRQFGDALYTALWKSEDANIMFGDILKAYGYSGIYHPEEIGQDYKVLPGFDPIVASQIQNATILGDFGSINARGQYTTPEVIQKTDGLNSYMFTQFAIHRTHNPNYKITEGFADLEGGPRNLDLLTSNKYINCYHDNPTKEFTMESTRLTCMISPYSMPLFKDGEWVIVDQYGSEIVTSVSVFEMDYTTGMQAHEYVFNTMYNTFSYTDSSTIKTALIKQNAITKFNYAPQIQLVHFSETDFDTLDMWALRDCRDLSVMGSLDYITLGRLHETALYSLLQNHTMS